jgi:hypothetical protein
MAGGPPVKIDTGATPSAAAGQVRNGAAPAYSIDQQIIIIGTNLRGRQLTYSPERVRILKRMDNGELMGKDDFEKFFELGNTGGVSNRFWQVFAEGKQQITKQELLTFLQHCKSVLEASGEAFTVITHNKYIVVTNPRLLGEEYKKMGIDPNNRTGVLNPLFWRTYDTAKKMKDSGTKINVEEITMQVMANQLIERLAKDKGFKRVKDLDLTDPLVVKRFTPMLKKFIVENKDDIPESEVNALVDFSQKVKEFRKWVKAQGWDYEATIARIDVDVNRRVANAPSLDQIVTNYQSLGREGVLRALKAYEIFHAAVPTAPVAVK